MFALSTLLLALGASPTCLEVCRNDQGLALEALRGALSEELERPVVWAASERCDVLEVQVMAGAVRVLLRVDGGRRHAWREVAIRGREDALRTIVRVGANLLRNGPDEVLPRPPPAGTSPAPTVPVKREAPITWQSAVPIPWRVGLETSAGFAWPTGDHGGQPTFLASGELSYGVALLGLDFTPDGLLMRSISNPTGLGLRLGGRIAMGALKIDLGAGPAFLWWHWYGWDEHGGKRALSIADPAIKFGVGLGGQVFRNAELRLRIDVSRTLSRPLSAESPVSFGPRTLIASFAGVRYGFDL